MDTSKKIHIELLRSLTKFSEAYTSYKSYKKSKNSYSNLHKKQPHEKFDSQRFSTDLIKKEKINSNNTNINSSKHNYQHSYSKKSQLTNNLHEKTQFYKNDRYKSQDKPIKINLVNLKFKIANDFNEKNSNQFLKEKDECLREIILSDKIEEDSLHFYEENEKGSIYELSYIKKNEYNYNLNNKQINRKSIHDDSVDFLSELIKELK